MKNKSLEALKDISYLILQEVDDLKNKDLWKEALNTIKQDLERKEQLEKRSLELVNKEKSKKPIYENDLVDENVVVNTWAYCPTCKEEIPYELWENLNYCPNCEQKLDWSDDE